MCGAIFDVVGFWVGDRSGEGCCGEGEEEGAEEGCGTHCGCVVVWRSGGLGVVGWSWVGTLVEGLR